MPDFPRNTRRLLDRQVSGHRGANNRRLDWLLDRDQLADSQNIRTADPGRLTRRLGAEALGGNTAQPGGGIAEFFAAAIGQAAGTRVMSLWGGKLYESIDADGGWIQVGCGATFADDTLYHAVVGRIDGKRCIAFTVAEQSTAAPMIIYDTTLGANPTTHVTEVIGPRALAFFEQRYWISNGDNLYWSQILETAGFSASANVLAVEPGLGGNITSLIPSRDAKPRLYVLKDEAIMLLEPRWGASSALIPTAGDALDTINTNLFTLTVGIGCVATRSVQWVPGNAGSDVLFLSQDGVRGLARAEQDAQRGAGFPESYGIQKWIDRINFTHAHKAASGFFDNAYHLAVPLDGATQNTHVLRRDSAEGAWSLIDWQAKDMKSFRLGTSHRIVFQNNFTTTDSAATAASADNLFQLYTGYKTDTDPGNTSVPFSFQTRAFVFDEPSIQKRWDSLTFQVSSAETSIMEIMYRTDFGIWNTLDTLTVNSSSDTTNDFMRRRNVNLSDITPGHSIQFQFNNVTGTTESGQLSIFMIDVHAFELPDTFESGP